MRSMSSPRAVSMRMGVSPRRRISRVTSMPSRPGSMRSSTTRSGSTPVVLPQGFLAVARLDDREAGLLQVEAHELDDVALVVDDEDGLHESEDSPEPSSTGPTHVRRM